MTPKPVDIEIPFEYTSRYTRDVRNSQENRKKRPFYAMDYLSKKHD